MLTYLRERREALHATPARRAFSFASALVICALIGLGFASLVPQWLVWAAIAASFVLDTLLSRKWIREDFLKAYQADHAV